MTSGRFVIKSLFPYYLHRFEGLGVLITAVIGWEELHIVSEQLERPLKLKIN